MEIGSEAQITQISGSLNRGGWEVQFTLLSPSGIAARYTFVIQRTTNLVERWQNITVKWRGAFGGPPGPPRLAFNGYTIPQRFQFDRTMSTAKFIAQTSDGILRRGWCQGIGFAEVTDRANYHQFEIANPGCGEPMAWDMRMGKLVKHILGYYDQCNDLTSPQWVAHTNMVYHPTENPHGWITLDNVDTTNSCKTARYIVRETNNLWSRLREIARNEFYELVFDKTDTLFYKPHPMYVAPLPAPVMTFDESFIVTPPQVQERNIDVLRQVKLHAVTDEGDTMHADYPASPTHTYGNVLDISRIRCNAQASLDLWAERKYKFENREYTVRWTAPGLCGLLFEILDRVQITYSGTDANGVHLEWNEKKFWIHEIVVTPDPAHGGRTVFTLEEENV